MNILNGHHRIEACVRSGVPTPIIAVARVADSWGPPEDPEKYLRDAWEPFIRK